MRQTSIQAFYKVKASGILSKLRLKVYEIVCYHGPLTANEMRGHVNTEANSGVFSTRLSELQRMGAVKVVGKRPCNTTGHVALVWDITGDMPVKHENPYGHLRAVRKAKKKEVLDKILILSDRTDLRTSIVLKSIYSLVDEL